MGANTVEDAYVIQIEDLIKEPSLTVVTARRIFALLQHHCVHKEYPADLNVPIPHAVTNSIHVPLKSKSVQAFPKFSGLLEDWLAWKKEAKAILGFNGWLQVATHKVVSSDPQFVSINNSLYWSLLQAVMHGDAQHCIRRHENSGDGNTPNGNGAWHALELCFETTQATEIMTISLEQALSALKYKDSDDRPMRGFIDHFNQLCWEHAQYCGPEQFTPQRKKHMFRDVIRGTVKYRTAWELSFLQDWDLKTLQDQLRLMEVQHTPSPITPF